MIRLALFLGLLGLAAAIALYLSQDIDGILATFATAGLGIIWSGLVHFAPIALNARAWQVLLPEPRRGSLGFFVWTVWLREAVNGLLPVARIGGEVVSARLLVRHGVRGPRAVGSLILDMTVSLGSQSIFTLIGIGYVLYRGQTSEGLVRMLIFGLAAAAVLGGVFIFVQWRGLFGLLARLAQAIFGNRFARLVGGAAALDRAVRALYRRRGAILACLAWQLLGWLAGAGEIGVALYFLGQPPDLGAAIIIEAAIQALGSISFVVPGALGIQEGGFLAAGSLVGLTPETALALALVRRARDLIIFAPALLVWQVSLGRRLLARA